MQYAAVTKDAAQRRSWTFYEAIILVSEIEELTEVEGIGMVSAEKIREVLNTEIL